MKRKILMILGGIMLTLMMAGTPKVALAADEDANFLGFKPWWSGICDSSGNCGKDITKDNPDSLKSVLWLIVLNITFDLTYAIGVLGMIMIVYGGYMYITSSGDPAKAARGQKTLMRAIIGMVIALGASVVVNTIRGFTGFASQGASVGSIVKDSLDWAFTVAGMIAVGFIIKAGLDFIMSQGDAAKTSKAIRGIIYAVVGLVIVIASSMITNFVLSKTGLNR